MPITQKETDAIADAVVDAIKKTVDPLRARISALEARPALKYFGVHQSDIVYDEGSLVTKAGSLWIATRHTAGRPGGEETGWKMIVKSGTAA